MTVNTGAGKGGGAAPLSNVTGRAVLASQLLSVSVAEFVYTLPSSTWCPNQPEVVVFPPLFSGLKCLTAYFLCLQTRAAAHCGS